MGHELPSTGRMLRAVQTDLARYGSEVTGEAAALTTSALILAQAIDSYSSQAKTAAELAAITRAISELRTVMEKLSMGVPDRDGDDERSRLSTPSWDPGLASAVRNTAQSGAADAGPKRGRSGAESGQTAAAASAGDR